MAYSSKRVQKYRAHDWPRQTMSSTMPFKRKKRSLMINTKEDNGMIAGSILSL